MNADSFTGPLGGYRNYITHIALPNYVDYLKQKKQHEEEKRSGTAVKYDEFRLFVNAVESFNNIADYLYWEYEDQIKPKHDTVDAFRNALHTKFPDLRELAQLANAYKHCVRTTRGKENTRSKNKHLPWAKHLQQTILRIHVEGFTSESPSATAEYGFSLVEEYEVLLSRVFGFWLDYHNNPKTSDLIAA